MPITIDLYTFVAKLCTSLPLGTIDPMAGSWRQRFHLCPIFAAYIKDDYSNKGGVELGTCHVSNIFCSRWLLKKLRVRIGALRSARARAKSSRNRLCSNFSSMTKKGGNFCHLLPSGNEKQEGDFVKQRELMRDFFRGPLCGSCLSRDSAHLKGDFVL